MGEKSPSSLEKLGKTDWPHLSMTPGPCPDLKAEMDQGPLSVYLFSFCLETFPD